MENLEIYNKYKDVPENALKDFDNGRFSGTDINTMWRIKCLTEQFGPCGIGWYFEPVRIWTENGANDEVMAFAQINLYVKSDGEWSKPIPGIGGNTMTKYVKKQDKTVNSDECYKMAVTDAFGVACKYLGIGASVYWDADYGKYTQPESGPEPQPEIADIDFLRKAQLLEVREKNKVDGAYAKELAKEYGIKKIADAPQAIWNKYIEELSAWNGSTQ